MKPEQRSSTQDLTAIPGCKSVDLHGGRIAADLNECRPFGDGEIGAFQAPTHVSFWNSNSFWYYTRSEQAKFINSPVLFEANRLKNFFPSEWHREHQIVYVKADLLKVAGRVLGGVAI